MKYKYFIIIIYSSLYKATELIKLDDSISFKYRKDLWGNNVDRKEITCDICSFITYYIQMQKMNSMQ